MISQTWIIGKAIRALFADRVTFVVGILLKTLILLLIPGTGRNASSS